jgi:hypothetical protein
MLVLLAGLAFGPRAALAADTGKHPPAELRNLEREVSLKLAHVRDEGPTDPVQRRQLHDAQQLDMKAEQAMAAGDYDTARDSLVKANVILVRLGM